MGLDLMCANEDAAKAILFANGYVHTVGPEIHGGDGYYPHFHPNRHTHTHTYLVLSISFYEEDESVSNS